MSEPLYDPLEVCLQALEQGADMEACLALFPSLADELRPILAVAVEARAQAVQDVPAAGMRAGRARVLQHAAEMRERRHVDPAPVWRRAGPAGRVTRMLATFVVTGVFLLSSGTGLVFASSGALPGDRLYTIKRGWEDVQLALIADPAVKSEREMEFEHERINEIETLFAESRKTQVDFQGVVQSQQPGSWQIAGLKIGIDPEMVADPRIVPGSVVEVIGETENGLIKAERIILLASPGFTPVPTASPRPEPSETLAPRKTETQEPGEDDGQTAEVENTQSAEKTETSGSPDGGETPLPGGDHSGNSSSSDGGQDGGGSGHSSSGGDGGGDGGGG